MDNAHSSRSLVSREKASTSGLEGQSFAHFLWLEFHIHFFLMDD
jgi:hypothetical protein